MRRTGLRPEGHRFQVYVARRLRVVLAIVSMVAALAAATSWSSVPASAATVTAQVVLYDDASFSGADGQIAISGSQPDLGQTGWAGRISSLRILGGISIAVYSQQNYAGTCDTFVGHDPWLGNNRIGNDQIASIRLFSNCAGFVVDPVVVDMTAVTGSSDQVHCPENYVTKETNLNEGAGGDFIYLCLRYESKATAGDSALTGVIDYVGLTPPIFACSNTSSGPTQVPVDLNKGVRGSAVAYLCYYTVGNNNPDPNGVDGRLRDVEFVVTDDPGSLQDVQAACDDLFEDVAAGTISAAVVNLVPDDLNYLAHGKFIFACTLNYEFALATPPDLTPPTISYAGSTPAPNAFGWNNTSVTLRWNCSDSGGVVSPQVTHTLSLQGRNQSATGTCVDNAGNMSSDTRTGINIDTGPPGITFLSRTPPNANGWNNSLVAVLWTCTDSLSGPLRQTEVTRVSTEGVNQSAIGTCTDLAGNTASDTQTGINIDRTAPTLNPEISPAANAFGWHRGNVSVKWNCADERGGSGLAAPCPISTITGEGGNLSASQSATDRAGNEANAGITVAIDRTPPDISAPSFAPPANANGWNNGDVTVTWTCADSLSGVFARSTSQDVTGEGSNLSATGTCHDRADNTASNTATGIKIDRTAPDLSASATTADGAPYTPGTWTNQDVTVTFTCTDRLSGVASVTAPQTVRTSGADQSVDGRCVDSAGNHSQDTVTGINIDKAAPVMTCSADPATLWPPNHKLVPVSVAVQTTDDLSGPGTFALMSAASTEPDNGRADGNTTGDIQGFRVGTADTAGLLRAERSGNGNGRVYTLSYQGTDAAGNTASCQAIVNVARDAS